MSRRKNFDPNFKTQNGQECFLRSLLVALARNRYVFSNSKKFFNCRTTIHSILKTRVCYKQCVFSIFFRIAGLVNTNQIAQGMYFHLSQFGIPESFYETREVQTIESICEQIFYQHVLWKLCKCLFITFIKRTDSD